MPQAVASLQESTIFGSQKRCDTLPELDYCSLQSYSQCPAWTAATLAHLWFSRLLFCGGEGPKRFLSVYKKVAKGRSFQADVAAQTDIRATPADNCGRAAIASCHSQGTLKNGSCREHAAQVLAQLVTSKRVESVAAAISSCKTEKEMDDEL